MDESSTSSLNVAMGEGALLANTGGIENVAVGASALREGTTPAHNVAVGYGALCANAAAANVAIGYEALRASSNGTENVAIGFRALPDITDGRQNIAIGSGAGTNLTAGSNNINIGAIAPADESNTTRIGTHQQAVYLAGIAGQIGAEGVGVLVGPDGRLATMASSVRCKHEIADLADPSDVLLALRPVSFTYLPKLDPTQTTQVGLIAEEVAAVAPGLVTRDVEGRPTAVRYHLIGTLLLAALQRQRRTLAEQAATLERQAGDIADLERRVVALAAHRES